MDDSFGDTGILGGWGLKITTAGQIQLSGARLRLAGVTNGHFQFTVDGVQGGKVVVQANTDVTNPNGWVPIATNVFLNGTSYNYLEINTNLPYRFYRAFEQ